jgi:hypothetical protein
MTSAQLDLDALLAGTPSNVCKTKVLAITPLALCTCRTHSRPTSRSELRLRTKSWLLIRSGALAQQLGLVSA